MEKDQSNKILISDYQVLPALLNNKNYAPNKWFDPISIPDKKNKYFRQKIDKLSRGCLITINSFFKNNIFWQNLLGGCQMNNDYCQLGPSNFWDFRSFKRM